LGPDSRAMAHEGRTQCLITVDVEADNQWEQGRPLTFANVAGLPDFQRLCDDFGLIPTYLVTYQVASDPCSREVLQALAAAGNCEVGAHCHAWSTPPLDPQLDTGEYQTFLYEYPAHSQREKLASLTEVLAEALGRAPRSHRAGRFGIDGPGMQILQDLGYLVDTSVTPLQAWPNARGAKRRGPCYVNAPGAPYHPSLEDLNRPGSMPILEVPVTIDFACRIPTWLRSWLIRHRGARGGRPGLFTRLAGRVGPARVVWLRPTFTSGAAMARLSRRHLDEGRRTLNLMFHSSELVLGCSPHTVDRQGTERVWAALREVFGSWAAHPAAVPLGLTEAALSCADPDRGLGREAQ
jgi:hypothetical protein